MSNVSEVLGNVVDAIKYASDQVAIYYKKLEFVNFTGTNPEESAIITRNTKKMASIGKLRTMIGKIPNNSTIVFIDAIGEIYVLLSKLYHMLRESYNCLSSYRITVDMIGSSTSSGVMTKIYVEDVIVSYEQMDNAWRNVKAAFDGLLAESALAAAIVARMHDDKNKLPAATHLTKTYESYRKRGNGIFFVGLFGAVIRNIFNSEIGDDPALVKYLQTSVEDLKRKMFPEETRHYSNRYQNAAQYMIQRYNMVPLAPPKPLPALITDLFGVDGDISHLSTVGEQISTADKRIGFIVINKTTSSPIEHNIWKLYDKRYIKELGLDYDPAAGVSAKTIIRSETIIRLKPGDAVAPSRSKTALKFGFDVFDSSFDKDNTKNYYYVLDTLDGIGYRLLVSWHVRFTLADPKRMLCIPAKWATWASGDPKDGFPSSLVESYNKTIESAVVIKLNKPYESESFSLSRVERAQKQSFWERTRGGIAAHMRTEFVAVAMSGAMKSITRSNIIDFISTPAVYNGMIRYMMANIKKVIATSTEKVRHYNNEIYLSALGDVNKMKSQMANDVRDVYESDFQDKITKLLPVAVGSKAATADLDKLMNMIEELLNEVLKKYITSKSNAFISIEYKMNLLDSIFA